MSFMVHSSRSSRLGGTRMKTLGANGRKSARESRLHPLALSAGFVVAISIAMSMSTMTDAMTNDDLSECQNVGELQSLLTEMVNRRDHALALVQLNQFDLDTLVDTELGTLLRESDGDSIPECFLGVAGQRIDVPGVPEELRRQILLGNRACIMPGTGDAIDLPEGIQWEVWTEQCRRFCLRYNSRLYLRWAEQVESRRYGLEEDVVRRRLSIDRPTWETLPVEVRVILIGFESERAQRASSENQ